VITMTASEAQRRTDAYRLIAGVIGDALENSDLPRYFIRCEVGNDPYHEVSKETYYWYEERYSRWCEREAPDGSWFSGRGIQGWVLRKFRSETDVISEIF
jgi:hypothetical protein